MPIYMWECQDCKKKVEVIRSFSDYSLPPDKEEAPIEESCEHKNWIKILGNFLLARGKSWTGKKGHWLYLLMITGGYEVCRYLDMLI